MTGKPIPPYQAHGWTIFVHPVFLQQLHQLEADVEKLRAKHPNDFIHKNASKRLKAILEFAFDKIPQDPTLKEYRQGNTLGNEHRHWFRAKFFQQYRIFFRYHESSRILVFGWVNDQATKRAYNDKNDAYKVFGRMLANGCPPDGWNELLAESKKTADPLSTIVSPNE